MKILLTGFEPFGGSGSNPSERVARSMEGISMAGLDAHSRILPVDRVHAADVLLQALEEVKPEVVLCLGEAPRRPVVSIERVAINLLDYPIKDNLGEQVKDIPIRADGPAAYFVTLPVRPILERLIAAGIPAELSLSAGTFLCNQVLYTLLDHLSLQEKVIPAGFIHLPSLPEQVTNKSPQSPSMALETSLKAVQMAIEVIAETLGK
jgi:pyroglutamyl-peptidase